jgi:hypothetical protein
LRCRAKEGFEVVMAFGRPRKLGVTVAGQPADKLIDLIAGSPLALGLLDQRGVDRRELQAF